ncbi:MAG: peptidase T [Candidatus Lokiarchaeota archaeon]|nr:peptidase T [Candidatus Lokiarchaeota archaeon]
MKVPNSIINLITEKVISRFLKYVRIETTSDETSNESPSTDSQVKFGKLLIDEMEELGIKEIIHDEHGYIYAKISPTKGYEDKPEIGFVAHLDTSPSVSGINIEPTIHRNYSGLDISFEKNPSLILSPKENPELLNYINSDIITSKGDTLLGADDKAGIAEIITACEILLNYPEIEHGPIIIALFPDEEIGKGTQYVDISKIPKICYTIDGSEMGLLQIECFDAWKIKIIFNGLNVHPGYAKDIMVNSIQIACEFFNEIPKLERPEKTKEREGFYHLNFLKGNEEKSEAILIIRDFEESINQKRISYLEELRKKFEEKYKGVKITFNIEHQYSNMKRYIEKTPYIINFAKKAIKMADLDPIIRIIRGGTDGAYLSQKGIPTPNIFAGGYLYHSKKEFIPTIALKKATEVILNLILLYGKDNYQLS